jgi:hypothetical protein
MSSIASTGCVRRGAAGDLSPLVACVRCQPQVIRDASSRCGTTAKAPEARPPMSDVGPRPPRTSRRARRAVGPPGAIRAGSSEQECFRDRNADRLGRLDASRSVSRQKSGFSETGIW